MRDGGKGDDRFFRGGQGRKAKLTSQPGDTGFVAGRRPTPSKQHRCPPDGAVVGRAAGSSSGTWGGIRSDLYPPTQNDKRKHPSKHSWKNHHYHLQYNIKNWTPDRQTISSGLSDSMEATTENKSVKKVWGWRGGGAISRIFPLCYSEQECKIHLLEQL